MLDDNDIAKFKELYRARFGIELDDDTARRKLILLIKQMEAVYQPIMREEAEQYEYGDVKQNGKTHTF